MTTAPGAGRLVLGELQKNFVRSLPRILEAAPDVRRSREVVLGRGEHTPPINSLVSNLDQVNSLVLDRFVGVPF
jgi:hypothetical protein